MNKIIKMFWKKWKKEVIFGGIIAIPFIVDWFIIGNNFPSNISNEAWVGFLGSYIGSLCTMAAVYITIIDNDKKLKKQYDLQEIQDKEQKRLNVRPYLDTRATYFDYDINMQSNDRVFDIEDEVTKKCHYNITSIEKERIKIENRNEHSTKLYINYTIRNIGAGSAVDMVVSVNDFKEPLAIAKDESVQLLCIIMLKEIKTFDIKIKLNFSDIENRGQYLKEEIIHIVPCGKDNDKLAFKLERNEQKLIDNKLK